MMMNGLKISIAFDCDCTKLIKPLIPVYEPIVIGKHYPILIESDSTVNEEHVKFYKNPGGQWQMTDASQYGTYIRIAKAKPIKVAYGIFIVCGKTWINTANRQSIEVINSNFDVIKTFTPTLNMEYTIGKQGTESIVIAYDECISSFHAKLVFTEDGVIITDWKNGTGSSNGTYISLKSMPITEEFILRIGLQTFCKVEPLYVSPSQYEPGSYTPPYINTMPLSMHPEQQTVKFGDKIPTPISAPIQSPMMNMTYQGDKPTYNYAQQSNTLPVYTPGPRPQMSPPKKSSTSDIKTNKWE
jgi:FHA domain